MGGETVNMTIWDKDVRREDYSIVEGFASQNRVRHALSILEKTKLGNFSVLPCLYEIMIFSDENGYKMFCYTRNWPGRGSFLAGVLIGQQNKWKKNERKRNRRNKRRQ
jgi:hypothetical protein